MNKGAILNQIDQKREALKNETLGKLLLEGLRNAGLNTDAARQNIEALKYRAEEFKPNCDIRL